MGGPPPALRRRRRRAAAVASARKHPCPHHAPSSSAPSPPLQLHAGHRHLAHRGHVLGAARVHHPLHRCAFGPAHAAPATSACLLLLPACRASCPAAIGALPLCTPGSTRRLSTLLAPPALLLPLPSPPCHSGRHHRHDHGLCRPRRHHLVLLQGEHWGGAGAAAVREGPASGGRGSLAAGSRASTLIVPPSVSPPPLLLSPHQDTFPFIGGVASLCLSWIFSPVLGAALAAVLFFLLRTFVLRHDNAYKRAFFVLPIFGESWGAAAAGGGRLQLRGLAGEGSLCQVNSPCLSPSPPPSLPPPPCSLPHLLHDHNFHHQGGRLAL